MTPEKEQVLSGYRVLDLTDDKGLLCGKLLADMGADVIKIEPPGGSPARNIGPFYKDIPDPEKSLYWFAYNTNKRGITLDIEQPDGQELFKRLVKTADVVVESAAPGYMASRGLGYDDLCKVKPDIIMTSITPFGQTGPYAHYKGSDLVLMGLGGYQYLNGDPDRAPVRISWPEAYLHAGGEAATASLMAIYYREASGEGQYVDLSAQTCVVWILMNVSSFSKLHGINVKRQGTSSQSGVSRLRNIFPCKDGYAYGGFRGGAAGGFGLSSIMMVKWMAEEGVAPNWLKEWDFISWDMAKYSTDPDAQQDIDRMEETLIAFLKTKTKQEVFDRAFRDRMLFTYSADAKDHWENVQLRAREFWIELEHPELGESLPYAGPFVKFSNNPIQFRHRAPLIGEHNLEVYQELGLSKAELVALKQARVI